MQSVAELPIFTKQAEKLFTESQKHELINFLAMNPSLGDEIPGTGGVRKLRFAAKGKGKRGGARVIYFWYDDGAPIYALLVYGKNQKTDMTAEQKKIVAAFAKAIKTTMRKKEKQDEQVRR